MNRKVAVLVRDRQSEALRMALGLTLADDAVDVYVLDRPLQTSDQDSANLELMQEMGIHLYSNHPDNTGMEQVATADVARRLVEYDHVLPY